MKNLLALLVILTCALRPLTAAPLGKPASPTGRTTETGVFLLMFDDSWPSHWQVAIPELQQRGLIANLLPLPGKGEYKVYAQKWGERIGRLRHGLWEPHHDPQRRFGSR